MTDPLLRLETQVAISSSPLPGTNYQVTFRKLADYPGISASHNIQEEPDPPITPSEFLALAWRIANDKRRRRR